MWCAFVVSQRDSALRSQRQIVFAFGQLESGLRVSTCPTIWLRNVRTLTYLNWLTVQLGHVLALVNFESFLSFCALTKKHVKLCVGYG